MAEIQRLENVLLQYIEKEQVETFVSKICRSGYRNQEEYFYIKPKQTSPLRLFFLAQMYYNRKEFLRKTEELGK